MANSKKRGQNEIPPAEDGFYQRLQTIYLEQSNRFNTAVTNAAGLGSAIVAALLSFGDMFERTRLGASFLVVSAIVLVLAGSLSGASDFVVQRQFSLALDKLEINADHKGAEELVEGANNVGHCFNWATAFCAGLGLILFCVSLIVIAIDYKSK